MCHPFLFERLLGLSVLRLHMRRTVANTCAVLVVVVVAHDGLPAAEVSVVSAPRRYLSEPGNY